MEELQDAIEDAQYVNAIATQEEGPRPVLPWEKPTEEQLLEWEEAKRPHVHTLDWTLSTPIGLFLFSSYLKQRRDDYLRINFCEEVLRFKKLQQGRARFDKGHEILEQFLERKEQQQQHPKEATSSSAIPETSEKEENGAAAAAAEQPPKSNSDKNGDDEEEEAEVPNSCLPPRTEIDEYDLERTPPRKQLAKEEVDKLLAMNMDYPVCSSTVVGLKGPAWKEVHVQFQQIQELLRMGPRNSSVRGMPSSVSEPRPSGTASVSSSLPAKRIEFQSIVNASAAEQESSENKEADNCDSKEAEDAAEEAVSSLSLKSNSVPNVDTTEDLSSSQISPDEDHHAPSPPPRREVKKGHSMEELDFSSMQGMTQRWLRSSAHDSFVPEDIFDTAERVVMESLRRQYWQSFLESEEYAKFKNFMWYQDRRVVPDDFFVMRVLGRGGFGLVTGKRDGIGAMTRGF